MCSRRSTLALGTQLIHTIMYLLYLPGFTADAGQYKAWISQLENHEDAVEAARQAREGELVVGFLSFCCVL